MLLLLLLHFFKIVKVLIWREIKRSSKQRCGFSFKTNSGLVRMSIKRHPFTKTERCCVILSPNGPVNSSGLPNLACGLVLALSGTRKQSLSNEILSSWIKNNGVNGSVRPPNAKSQRKILLNSLGYIVSSMNDVFFFQTSTWKSNVIYVYNLGDSQLNKNEYAPSTCLWLQYWSPFQSLKNSLLWARGTKAPFFKPADEAERITVSCFPSCAFTSWH